MNIIDIDEVELADGELDRSKVCDECWQIRSLRGTCGCIG